MMNTRHLLVSLLMLVLMLMACPAMADVTIDETTFPDVNFRSWVKSQTYGSDGVLTDAEIAGVTVIDVNGKSIQSLKGIEYFTKLTMLLCFDNQLTTLNISKNRELGSLYCDNNQLTELDLSKNTALTRLSCSGNQLTVLDVSKKKALKSLSCGGNQLTILDVSKNTALGFLDCGSNQLTALDVSKNTALRVLSCNSNQLTALDLSKNVTLITLLCHRNQIKGTSMDALLESLSTRNAGGKGTIHMMRVIYNEGEQNEMTTTQVAAAKAKGWTPCFFTGKLDEKGYEIWSEYAGSDPTGNQ